MILCYQQLSRIPNLFLICWMHLFASYKPDCVRYKGITSRLEIDDQIGYIMPE